MLERLRLTDFKSFVDQEAELAPLTLLVGANASGKSNFLDAIRVLVGLSLGLSIVEVLDGEERVAADRWPGIRGGSRETARVGTSSFAIESTWRVPELEFKYLVRCPVRGVLVDTFEKVDGQPLAVGESVSHQRALQAALSRVRLLAIAPPRMRGYGRRSAPLGDEGKNISGVLARLCDDPAEKRAIVEWLAELCSPELADLDFIEVPELGDVMAVLVEKGGRRITARSLSDGTLRFLGTLVALRTAEPGSVILMEEIEADLHPTRIRLLVEYLEAVTRERDVQIIATTHSPVVLQWLGEEALKRTLVFGRVPEREGTLMRRLGELPHFDEIVKRKGIGALFTTGWLEMAL
jgi:predicted ATPase